MAWGAGDRDRLALDDGALRFHFRAERLSLPPSHFLDEQNPAWSRLAVDMTLAAGDWQAAADGYASLLEVQLDEQSRAEAL